MNLYIGLMSGTSMDGIDAALVDLNTNTLLHGITQKYSEKTKKKLESVLDGYVSVASICQLNTLIGQDFAHAACAVLANSEVKTQDVVAIGSHGQTIAHNTQDSIPYTLQLGCPHTISSLTGITVVADFRTRDLVNGGEGAPFAPLYHQELFKMQETDIAILNIGGIANISYIMANKNTRGWDIGPGNCLMDAWISKHKNVSYDANGAWASEGTVIESLLLQLLSDPYFQLPNPKSIGKEYFSLGWLETYLQVEYTAADVQATLAALTAHSIAEAVLNDTPISSLYLCGGGTHNNYLRTMLVRLLPNVMIKSVADVGLHPDYIEAMMFAWLAGQTIEHIPIDLTRITGSKAPAILGAIYPITRLDHIARVHTTT